VPDLTTKKQGCAWVFDLAAVNMAHLAALMCLQGHVKNNLSCLGEDKTLLANEQHFTTAKSDARKEREGVYLYRYYDCNDEG
jgi:hypothetical protein